MLCENIQRIMDDKKVTEEYKTLLQDYINRLMEMLDVVTLMFSDGACTIERSRLVPFGVLWAMTQNYDENELENVVIPRSRETFLILLKFIDAVHPTRRWELIEYNTKFGASLLRDAKYFNLPSASQSELYRLVDEKELPMDVRNF
jgi:hypothetical protein